ncbi:MucR family transcriptional regulator [Methylobacterium pseudosasicola]|uniref:Transcriptional regulator, MucR family n=1 Tax=Methylobacterium pseudosasicola TaxID=582667 RepID=A0A1I4SCX4_9HYPH|nr:MucR family transcriptional regulator [Methylobacterium pseudosasicola]SFM62174.1 transcriptional regulator, MucR family [Methylobacterium pseudosasicola]
MTDMIETSDAGSVDFVELTTGIVSAYVSNNHIQGAELAALIANTHAALTGLGQGGATASPATEKLTPAQIRKSITPDALISFEDGKPYKTLRRHLTIRGLTAEAYRERYGLPRDYPMTAASYSEQRSKLAMALGLGQQRKKASPKAAEPAAAVSDKPKRAGRPRKAKEAAEA